jgi:hypothetical protein
MAPWPIRNLHGSSMDSGHISIPRDIRALYSSPSRRHAIQDHGKSVHFDTGCWSATEINSTPTQDSPNTSMDSAIQGTHRFPDLTLSFDYIRYTLHVLCSFPNCLSDRARLESWDRGFGIHWICGWRFVCHTDVDIREQSVFSSSSFPEGPNRS